MVLGQENRVGRSGLEGRPRGSKPSDTWNCAEMIRIVESLCLVAQSSSDEPKCAGGI